MFQTFVADTSVSRVTTSVIAWISEPFEQLTFCKGECTSKIDYFVHLTLNVFAIVGASDYLPSAYK